MSSTDRDASRADAPARVQPTTARGFWAGGLLIVLLVAAVLLTLAITPPSGIAQPANAPSNNAANSNGNGDGNDAAAADDADSAASDNV